MLVYLKGESETFDNYVHMSSRTQGHRKQQLGRQICYPDYTENSSELCYRETNKQSHKNYIYWQRRRQRDIRQLPASKFPDAVSSKVTTRSTKMTATRKNSSEFVYRKTDKKSHKNFIYWQMNAKI